MFEKIKNLINKNKETREKEPRHRPFYVDYKKEYHCCRYGIVDQENVLVNSTEKVFVMELQFLGDRIEFSHLDENVLDEMELYLPAYFNSNVTYRLVLLDGKDNTIITKNNELDVIPGYVVRWDGKPRVLK